MGAVYRATSVEEGPAGPEGSPVALKVFHAHLVEEEQAFDRFRREAEIGMRIRHEHVVRTYGIGHEVVAGAPVDFMVLELIEGQTLASLLADLGTVPEQLLFQIADQVLDALGALHADGIVHRDVKPENVVITPDHRVLLMDLGVARLQARGQTMTQAGNFVGSLVYAAPEQFRSEEEAIGPAADIYAFGVVLFELATGKNPFALDSVHAVIQAKVLAGAPPPRSVNPDVDAFWNEVIVAATRTNAVDRFASAAEMRGVLREGEASAWWRAREAKVGRSVAEPALKRLRLEREVPLVGRADALAGLHGAWERARSGGSTVLLGGPSGVGKSRLLYEFLEQVAAEGGPAIAAGRCVGSGGRELPAVRRGAPGPPDARRCGSRRTSSRARGVGRHPARGHARRGPAVRGLPARRDPARRRGRVLEGRPAGRLRPRVRAAGRRAAPDPGRRGPPARRRRVPRALPLPRAVRAGEPDPPRRGVRRRRGRGGHAPARARLRAGGEGDRAHGPRAARRRGRRGPGSGGRPARADGPCVGTAPCTSAGTGAPS